MPLPVLMQDIAFLVIVTLLVRPVGAYLWRVFTGQRTLLDRLFRPIERGIYAVSGVRADHGMTATEYALAFVLFGLVNTLLLYGILRLQWALPNANAAALSTPLTPDLSFNTALSFSTTTTWQAYAGETTMGYWTQLLGRAAQNFIAGAAGLAVGVAVIRDSRARARRTWAISGWTSRGGCCGCCCRSPSSAGWRWSGRGSR